MVTNGADQGNRNFFMVNVDDPERARDAVNKLIGGNDAQALAPIPDATIEQYNLRPGQAWLCTTTNAVGEVTHSELK
jgi:hypothetical protein